MHFTHVLPGFTGRQNTGVYLHASHIYTYMHTCFQDSLIDVMSKFGEIECMYIDTYTHTYIHAYMYVLMHFTHVSRMH